MKKENIRLVYRKIDELIPYDKNAKLHPQEQIDKLVGSFEEFGRIVPAGIDKDGNLIYGHGRILAARQRGDSDFPCIEIDGLTETQRRAFIHAAKYILAENEYLRISSLVQDAIARGEPDDAGKWIAAQDKLMRQILTLGAELGITPKARRERGLTR